MTNDPLFPFLLPKYYILVSLPSTRTDVVFLFVVFFFSRGASIVNCSEDWRRKEKNTHAPRRVCAAAAVAAVVFCWVY